jgi:phospholipase C
MTCVRACFLATLVTITGCAQGSSVAPPLASPSRSSAGARTPTVFRVSPSLGHSKIQHVVIIVQENRSTNDLFNSLPGADTVRVGLNSHGQTVQLTPHLLTAPFDLSHRHLAFVLSYNKGQMNGFDQIITSCMKGAKCPPPTVRAYGYVPESEVKPYYIMARRYAFANHMFQSNEGPSFPAHQYLLSGTSTLSDGSPLRAAENPVTLQGEHTGGCDSPPGSNVWLIDPYGKESQTAFPCFNRNSLIQLLEANSLTWHYYQGSVGAGVWNGVDAISSVWQSPEFSTDVVVPPSQVLTDIDAGNLANVVWVIPTAKESDHAGFTDGSGPSWVATVVNKIGLSKYWTNTAIFVVWDDWGGWYDPVPPPQYNSYELGMRVPLIVISPYSKEHYVSTTQHEFGSILNFIEKAFKLPSLGTTDLRSDDLRDCFAFAKPPRKFVLIPAPLRADYFLRQPISNQSPDDDF